MKNLLKQNWFLFLTPLVFFLSTSFFWIDQGNFIAAVDYFPAFKFHDLYNAFFSWQEYNLGKEALLNQNNLFPYYLIWVSLYKIGFNLKSISIIWFTSLLSLVFYSFYYLTGIITKDKNARFVSSLFYTNNPFVVTMILLHSYIFSLIIIPIIIRFTYHYFNDLNKKYLYLLIVCQVFFLPIFQSPALTIFNIFFISLFIIYFIYKKYILKSIKVEKYIQNSISSILKLTLGLILVNLVVIIPAINFLQNQKDVIKKTITDSKIYDINKEISLKSQETSLLNLFILKGKWIWGNKGENGLVYLPYSLNYNL